MEIICNAKLNLSLDITGRREDGYHLMDMVMQSVNLCDFITARRNDTGILSIKSDSPGLPADSRNSVCKAANLLFDACGVTDRGLSVFIKKRIPFQAGLGGGSADAAGIMLAVRKLWNLSLNDAELAELGLEVGADVPFCLKGGTARVRGIGEIIEPLRTPENCVFVAAMPAAGVSTKAAFAAIDRKSGYRRPDTEALVDAVNRDDANLLAQNAVNVFASSGASEISAELAGGLRSGGAMGVSLSGSGAAVFGVFSDRETARRCRDFLREKHRAWVVCPTKTGVIISDNCKQFVNEVDSP